MAPPLTALALNGTLKASSGGLSLAPNAVSSWVGEAMGKTDFRDRDEVPAVVTSTVKMVARPAAHLARLLSAHPLQVQMTRSPS